ncbi:transcriptional adapter 2-beta [Nematocida homosporus]|uniref:transcriptional adapter 2-beta n=1 Tax=Nematocida homosporus TaxID=1912981 RepID=UPI00221F78E6|nr:transcriptional adapter 2-beta [Nematocida homosporus]KAI5186631.1 transcriptional adapter 2-beta [Nematocida homosporus]
MVVTHSKNRGNACLIRCDGCLMDVSTTLWMQCTVCNIDICPICLFKKVQINEHQPNHSYRVVKNLSFPADFSDWQLLEELLFVDGLIIHGIGNWEDVSTYIGRKSPQETQEHFYQLFHLNPNAPLEGPPVTDLQSNPLSQEISGYMPLRGDFELEYNNDAEMVIKEMTFSPTDTQLEKEMKEALLDAYHLVLLKRMQFRSLILDKGLLQAKKRLQLEKTLCTPGKDLLAKIKPLIKIMSPTDFALFFQGLYLEIAIKRKIKNLIQQYTQANRPETKKTISNFTEEIQPELLDTNEHTLCTSLGITPTVYLLLKEAAVINQFTPEKDRIPLTKLFQGLSEPKLTQLAQFFAQNGWITNE